jgi:hypothetical protein
MVLRDNIRCIQITLEKDHGKNLTFLEKNMPRGIYQRTKEMKTGKHMLGRAITFSAREKVSIGLKKYYSIPKNRKMASDRAINIKNSEFICKNCGIKFKTKENTHPSWCGLCRVEINKLNQSKSYLRNKDKILTRSIDSQKLFQEKHGISRASLLKHGMTSQEYDLLRKNGCFVCGYSEVLDIHRVKFGSNNEVVLLCPNHHARVHRRGYKLEKNK